MLVKAAQKTGGQMEVIDVDAARSQLSRLIERACRGEDIVIAQDGEPAVRLVPVPAREARRRPGSMEGLVKVGPEFFEPLPPEELDAWEQ